MGVCLVTASIAVSTTPSLLVNGIAQEPVTMLIADTTITDMKLCPGVVALTYAEYTSPELFFPAVEDMQAAFQAGFILPMAAFVLAYCVGRLPAMFNSDRGD